MPVEFRATGHFDEVERKVSAGLVDGLTEGVAHLLEVSQGRVPVEQGDLRATGQTDVDPETLTSAVSYGGDYPQNVKAVVQHEDLTLAHPNGGQPKYLESAFDSERVQVGQMLAAAVRRRL